MEKPDRALILTPIGVFHSREKEKYEVPRQPGLYQGSSGIIRLERNQNFEQALEDLDGFARIWVVFSFHFNTGWKPKVRTPRGTLKRGVFATRSPHRPNSIGLSCVELIAVDGLDLIVGSHDLLDGTPILDIKPYLPYSDSFPDSVAGWVDDLSKEKKYEVAWSERALNQAAFIKENGGPDLMSATACTLELTPVPHPSRRIREIGEGMWELGYKTWRLHFFLEEGKNLVRVDQIVSGYKKQELLGKDSWGDVELHKRYDNRYKRHRRL